MSKSEIIQFLLETREEIRHLREITQRPYFSLSSADRRRVDMYETEMKHLLRMELRYIELLKSMQGGYEEETLDDEEHVRYCR
jgi:hypothetical protein